MDPEANIRGQVELASAMVEQACIDQGDAYRLAELVLSLDEWLRKGGFRPARWTQPIHAPRNRKRKGMY